MRNAFGGFCYRCHYWVEPGKGHFEKTRGKDRKNGKWRVQHTECAIFYRELKEFTKVKENS